VTKACALLSLVECSAEQVEITTSLGVLECSGPGPGGSITNWPPKPEPDQKEILNVTKWFSNYLTPYFFNGHKNVQEGSKSRFVVNCPHELRIGGSRILTKYLRIRKTAWSNSFGDNLQYFLHKKPAFGSPRAQAESGVGLRPQEQAFCSTPVTIFS
jgi:hypothetical protein